MKKLPIHSELSVYASIGELAPWEKELCQAATEAIQLSYAAYSGYRVGCAVLMDDGSIVKGANQENAVYPLGLCAERVALFSAFTQYPGQSVSAIAVTTEKVIEGSDIPAFPCGSCRQSMVEAETRFNSHIPIYIFKNGGKVFKAEKVGDILPFAFSSQYLK